MTEHSPGTLTQLLQSLSEAALHNIDHPEQIVLRGRIGQLDDRGYSVLYGVALTDGSGTTRLDIPKRLATRVRLQQGDYIEAVGTIKTELSERTRNRLEFRLSVSDIRPAEPPELVVRQERAVLDRIVQIGPGRHPFPPGDSTTVGVICARGSQVLADFQHALGDIETTISTVNMADAGEIARAITSVDADILAVVRGGGDPEWFAAFNDMRVIEALAAHRAYKVLGLGHTGDRTVADLIVEHAAAVPAEAGRHIAEQWAKTRRTLRRLHWQTWAIPLAAAIMGLVIGRLL